MTDMTTPDAVAMASATNDATFKAIKEAVQ